MVTISLCMIVKNEEDVIGRCLKSVCDLVDEIIVVDTGSSDKTKEIAAQFTNKVYDFAWIDDFAAARNFAFSKSSCMYSMWFDADDIMIEGERQRFLELKEKIAESTNVVMMKYNTGFDNEGNVTFSFYRERIIKNNVGMRWVGAIHEVIQTIGKVEYSNCAVTHSKLHPTDADRNLNIFEKLIKNNVKLDPREQFYYGRELYYHQRFADAISVFEIFLDEDKGWLENKIDACKHCCYCYYGLQCNGKALQALFRSFEYDLPRAETCCDIGHHFFDRQQYELAIYWYERACACKRDDNRGGFVSPDAYGFTPCIQLCVCYSKIGEIQKAVDYNEKAALFKPEAKAININRNYFATLNLAK